MLPSFGAGLVASNAAQAASTLASAVAAWMVWRNSRINRTDRMALEVFLTLLATPFGYTDDLVPWSVALAALAQVWRWRIGLLDELFWLGPAPCGLS